MRESGFAVIETDDYREGIKVLADWMPHLVIVSEEVPEVWYAGALDTLKREEDVSVLMMGSGKENSLVTAIDRGADGYLDERSSFREQVARIRAVLRRLSMTRASQHY